MNSLRNLSLIASVASCFTQIGAQLFAIVVIVRTAVSAPPRSFAIYQGEYGYDSSQFWEVVPTLSLALLVLAIVANWRTTRRNLLLVSLALFIVGSAVAALLVEPGFGRLLANGYSNVVDPSLQGQAAVLYRYDWALWCVSLAAGVSQLVALSRPVSGVARVPDPPPAA